MFPLNILPEAYRGQWCVAGGWAACPPLATDMDVWVYDLPTDRLDAIRTELLEHLSALRQDQPRGPYFVPGEDVRAAQGYQHPCTVKKVAVVSQSYPAKPIHLMVTDASCPGEIIGGFDISTHAVAIGHNGMVHTHFDYTAPHVFPVQLKETETTPTRMAKIASRFGHTLEGTIGKGK